MSIYLVFAAVLIGPALYLLVTFSGSKPVSYSDYHYGGRTIPPHKFTDSTVMYAIQVAAITLFATWGYESGFWAIWVPVFWAVGYYAISQAIKYRLLDEFLGKDDVGTLHAFLAEKGRLRLLGMLAALASLLGVAGPAMFEAEYVGEAIVRISTASLDDRVAQTLVDQYAPLFFAGFVILAATYMLYGGFKAIVSTDVYQLGIGYSGLSFVLCALLFQAAANGYGLAALILVTLLAAMSVGLLVVWNRVFATGNRLVQRQMSTLPLYVGVMCYCLTLVAILAITKAASSLLDPQSWQNFIDTHKLFEPLSLGGMSLLSLLIANGLYQFVDIGQWQRLASVQVGSEEFDRSRETIRRAVQLTGTYSACTWVVAVFFGMALRYASASVGANPYEALSIFMVEYARAGAVGEAIVFTMILSLVAIMLSTLDSLVAGITFTIHNDWLVSFSDRFRTIGIGRAATVVFLLIAVYLYRILSQNVSNFADILYSCWAFQIALFPLVIVALLKRWLPGIWASLALVAGMVGATVPVGFPAMALSPYQYSPVLALIGSSLVLSAGLVVSTVFGTVGAPSLVGGSVRAGDPEYEQT